MEELKLYSVSDKYISYLRAEIPNVYSNKIDIRTHSRKYIGVVIKIDKFKYYIPMSSPKNSDYQISGDTKVIRKSVVPIIRIVVKNSNNQMELKGTLRISHMIPVSDSELELYDLNSEQDINYKKLVQNEIIFLRKNHHKITNNAMILYRQKAENDTSAGYIKSALPYQKLEVLYEKYCNNSL